MTRGEIWKDFFKKTVLTVLIAGVLFYWAALVFTKDGATNYFYVWLCCGIPFGIRRMFVWLIPRGFDLSGTVGVVALNFIVGGLIGGVILIWRLAVAAWYYPSNDISASKRRQGRRSRNRRGISKKRERGAAADDGHRAPSVRGCCFKGLLRSRTLFLRV